MLLKLNVLVVCDNGSLGANINYRDNIFLIRPEDNFILKFALLISIFASPTSHVMPVTSYVNFTRYEK